MFWKIGTKINKYLKFLKDIQGSFDSKVIRFIVEDKKVIIKTSDGNEINPQDFAQANSTSTFNQLISTWITLDFISLKNNMDTLENFYDKDFEVKISSRTDINEYCINYLSSSEILSSKIEDYINYSNENDKTSFEFTEEDEKNIFDFNNQRLFLNGIFACLLNAKYKFDKDWISSLFGYEEKEFAKVMKYYKILDDFQILSDYRWNMIEKNAKLFLFQNVENFDYEISDKDHATIISSIKQEIPSLSKLSNYEESKKEYSIESHLISFGSLITFQESKGIVFKIPIYQRNYKWDQSMISKLTIDILDIRDKSVCNYHYMGGIVINTNGPKQNFLSHDTITYKIVDGQQRFTSLLIIYRALYDALIINNIEPDDYLKKMFIKEHAEIDDNSVTKIFTHINTNSDFSDFKKIMLGSFKEVNANSLFKKNHHAVREILKKESFENLNAFTVNLLKQTLFTMTQDSSKNEFELFENLNTEKVELETIELIKNIIMMNIDDKDLDNNEAVISQTFDEKILSHFKNKDGKVNSSSINNFISSYVRFYKSSITDTNDSLYKEIEKSPNNKNVMYKIFKKIIVIMIRKYLPSNDAKMTLIQYNKLIQEISNKVNLFVEITTKEKFFETSSFLYNIGDILYSLDKRIIYVPILMKIIGEHLDENNNILDLDHLRKLLFEIEKYEIRFQVVIFKGQSLAKVMDSNILNLLTNSRNITPEYLANLFSDKKNMKKNSMPSLEEFKNNLLASPILKEKIANVICFRINHYLDNEMKINIHKKHNYFAPKFPSREHIIPQDLAKWEKELKIKYADKPDNYIVHKHEKVVDLLGNSMTINGWTNSSASNLPWKSKKIKYENESNVSNLSIYKGYTDKKGKVWLSSLKTIDDVLFKNILIRHSEMVSLAAIIYK